MSLHELQLYPMVAYFCPRINAALRPSGLTRARASAAVVDFGFAVVVFFFFLPQRHSAKALPAADVGFFAKVLPAFEHCALFMYI